MARPQLRLLSPPTGAWYYHSHDPSVVGTVSWDPVFDLRLLYSLVLLWPKGGL